MYSPLYVQLVVMVENRLDDRRKVCADLGFKTI